MRLVERDLGGDGAALVRREGGRIQLVAEDAEERDGGPRVERRDPADLVVRDGRDVGAHRAQRIDQRRAPLDPQALDRVGVVARPALRREGEDPGIEAGRRRPRMTRTGSPGTP